LVVIRPLQGEAPTIDLVVGYSRYSQIGGILLAAHYLLSGATRVRCLLSPVPSFVLRQNKLTISIS
jgi:hypothetical protein